MCVRRVVLSSFVLLAFARATCGAAGDLPDKPVLGSVEPIGELLVVKAGVEIEEEIQTPPLAPSSLPDYMPISVPPSLLLPAGITAPVGFGLPGNEMLRATARITPGEEIGFHLSQAVLGLKAAGLNEEADQASSLLREFQNHQARLVLAAKQAQLSELQAEIERLKLRVEKGITADQVQLSVMIIETDSAVAKEILGDHAATVLSEQINRPQPASKILDRKEFQRLVESKRANNSLKVLAEPTLVAQSGRLAKFHSGGSTPTPKVAQAGGPAELEWGTTVQATATIADKDLIRVALTAELAQLDLGDSVNAIPSVNRSRVQSTVEMKDHQTIIVGGLVSSTDEKSVTTIFTVTAEIIDPVRVIGVQYASPVVLPEPMPTSLRVVK